MPLSNMSDCPGSEVILELLRAEHEQVKLRTDIIKQLITYNCGSKAGIGNVSPKPKNQFLKSSELPSFKTNLSSNIADISTQFENLKQMTLSSQKQSSFNNRESRHVKCFLPQYDFVLDPKPNRCPANASYNQIIKESSNFAIHQKVKPKLPNYSQVQYENLNDLHAGPTYSQFQRDARYKSTPKKVLARDDASYSSSINNKTGKSTGIKKAMKSNQTDSTTKHLDQCTFTNQIDETLQNHSGYDYKLETHKLMQEVSDLKIASKRYEDEKSDWINEKRRQIRILQQLRDASCDETKAAMKLTSWKPCDIECNPLKYEESKRIWLLCKKNQIELLERLRGVSLNEIRKGIERISNLEGKSFDYDLNDDKCRSMADFTYLSQPCGQELYNSDKVSVRICGTDITNECIDKDKININILMKSNNNISDLPISNEFDILNPLKGGPSQNNSYVNKATKPPKKDSFKKKIIYDSKKLNLYKGSIDPMIVNDLSVKTFEKIPSSSSIVTECSLSNRTMQEMKKKIEDEMGSTLFRNTYNILSKLNCPELIVQSAKGDAKEAENVLSYILEERKFGLASFETVVD